MRYKLLKKLHRVKKSKLIVWIMSYFTCSKTKWLSLPSCSQDFNTLTIYTPAVTTALTLDVVIATIGFTFRYETSFDWLIYKALCTTFFSLTCSKSVWNNESLEIVAKIFIKIQCMSVEQNNVLSSCTILYKLVYITGAEQCNYYIFHCYVYCVVHTESITKIIVDN